MALGTEQKVVFITTSGAGSFTVPVDFGSLVSVEAIGGGGGSFRNATAAGSGGGAYAKSTGITGLLAGAPTWYSVGAGGTAGTSATSGGDTWFNAISNAAPTLSSQGVLAKGGTAATSATGAAGGLAASCIGTSSASGGNGGNTPSAGTKGGGGGAGGPGGAGGSSANGISNFGGPGGGSGATLTLPGATGIAGTNGSIGGNGGASTGQTGGSGAGSGGNSNNIANAVTAPANGGGGGGGFYSAIAGAVHNGGNGGAGTFWTQSSNLATAGSGGGGGGNASNGLTDGYGGDGGLYGGGAGGSSSAAASGGAGAQGIIVFTYLPNIQSGFKKSDDVFGTIDLDDQYVTDQWLVDKYVGGTLFAWGANGDGRLGIGNTTYYSSPVQVGALTNWKDIEIGIAINLDTGSSMGIKTDGTLWAWGSNIQGQLGLGNTAYYSSPVQVGTSTNWKQVNMGTQNSFTVHAVKTDGTLWAWGTGGSGTLGDGTTTIKSSPVQVGALTNWKQVSGEGFMAAAVKTDGTLWTWGQNTEGQLGIGVSGATSYYSSPVQVGTLTNWKYVSIIHWLSSPPLRLASVFGIKTDGTLWAWGNNSHGQLGLGNTAYYSSPVQVGTLTNWKQVSGAGTGSITPNVMAIKTDGTLWAWGNNSLGQLGLNYSTTAVYYSSPIQVGALTNWKQVSSKSEGCGWMAVKTDGTLWGCGSNLAGNLGNDNRTSYSSPIQIGSLNNWKKVVSSGSGTNGACGTSLGITFTDLN